MYYSKTGFYKILVQKDDENEKALERFFALKVQEATNEEHHKQNNKHFSRCDVIQRSGSQIPKTRNCTRGYWILRRSTEIRYTRKCTDNITNPIVRFKEEWQYLNIE